MTMPEYLPGFTADSLSLSLAMRRALTYTGSPSVSPAIQTRAASSYGELAGRSPSVFQSHSKVLGFSVDSQAYWVGAQESSVRNE